MSVISYLQTRASQAVLSASEESSIKTSISAIQSRLTSHFGSTVSAHFRFGSSTRETILPRSMDADSDIDYMIVFSDKNLTPQTYLDRLKTFAERYYASSDIKQSSPSIVLQLNHIKFDLVPALKQDWWSAGYRIPDGPTRWQDTDPNDFNKALNDKNAAESYQLKPAIRLVKYWNAGAGAIYDSFSLEKYVVAMGFWGVNNLREYVFTTIESLDLAYEQPQWRKDALARAKTLIKSVRYLEENGERALAEAEVKRLIPAG